MMTTATKEDYKHLLQGHNLGKACGKNSSYIKRNKPKLNLQGGSPLNVIYSPAKNHQAKCIKSLLASK